MLLAIAPAGFALLAGALWIVRSITLPVRRLQAATLDLAQGRRARRGAHHGNDELGDLARSFDRMIQHLEVADDALRAEMARRRQAQDEVLAVNAELEQRVLERTAKLQEINERLDAELGQRKHAERQLEQLAHFDQLTGLPNRGLFLQRLEQAIMRGRRTGKFVGLMFVDLDRFKSINDGLGHAIGDSVLQEVARRMVAVMRATDTVSRIGGDEFTVIVENVGEVQSLAAIATKLIEAFVRPVLVDGTEVFVTLSIGIAISPLDSSEGDELMRQADFAMYHAKAEGRDAFRFHTERMGEAAQRRLAIERALRHALERQEFTVHYQVRVGAATRQPVGMEALLRWNSPELGPVRPDEFVPIAEDIGIIQSLGAWVLRSACTQHTAWRLEGLQPGMMGVNVSARQFREPDFAATVARIAAQAGIAPEQLELEVTESLLMTDPESASMQMSQLRRSGFGIAIDDFGTGYSSLSHLKHFPATKIKIDRSFVRTIDTDPDDAAIAASIVALAKAVGILVTAEGVETEAQLARLALLECSEYQGYLFSEPLPAQGMADVLRQGIPRSVDVRACAPEHVPA